MTTPQDRAMEAANALYVKFSVCRYTPTRIDQTKYPSTEEIASILRPFMESEEKCINGLNLSDSNKQLVRDMFEKNLKHVTNLQAMLLHERLDYEEIIRGRESRIEDLEEESKRKDEEIRVLKAELQRHLNRPPYSEFPYPPYEGTNA